MASIVDDLARRVLAAPGDPTGTKVGRKLDVVRRYAAEHDSNVVDVLNDIRADRLEVFLRLDGTYVVRPRPHRPKTRRPRTSGKRS